MCCVVITDKYCLQMLHQLLLKASQDLTVICSDLLSSVIGNDLQTVVICSVAWFLCDTC